MANTIKISEFTGMNNIREEGGSIQSPRAILNAAEDNEGRIIQRVGQTLFSSTAYCHSLWACESVMLVCVDNRLYRVDNGSLVYITTMSSRRLKTYYVEVDEVVHAPLLVWQAHTVRSASPLRPGLEANLAVLVAWSQPWTIAGRLAAAFPTPSTSARR